MEISTSTIITTMQEDPKKAKEMLKSALQDTLLKHNSHTHNAKLANANILKNANTLLDSLFSKVIDGTTSKSEAVKTIQNSAVFKQDQNTMGDMQRLLTLVQKEPKLSRFIAPLQDFLKHISTSNAQNLSTQVKNSGIGLEAKLAKNSTPPLLSQDTKNLLNTFLRELQATPNIDKNTQNTINEIKNILNQKSVFKEDIQTLQKNLSNLIATLSKEKPSKTIQNLFQNSTKLESLAAKTPQNIPKNELLQLAKEAAKNIETFTSKANPNMPKLENLQSILKDIALIIKSLDNKTLTPQETQALVSLLSNQTAQMQPQTLSSINLTTQDQLKLLSQKLKQSMEIIDKQSLHVNQNQKSAKNVLSMLGKEATQLPSSKQATLPLKTIEQDFKQTLLKISEATSSSTTPAQKEINTIANKNLTNIQMHQLLSYANNSINTYMPYAWEGLSEGSVSFKKGKDESFYCQIDLELKVYGQVKMMLMLVDDKYLNISIATEKESLKEKINDNIQELKGALTKAGLTPLHVKMKPLEKNSYSDEEWSDFSMSLRV